jgi:PHP family Zn ribbon phosphoesterase
MGVGRAHRHVVAHDGLDARDGRTTAGACEREAVEHSDEAMRTHRCEGCAQHRASRNGPLAIG